MASMDAVQSWLSHWAVPSLGCALKQVAKVRVLSEPMRAEVALGYGERPQVLHAWHEALQADLAAAFPAMPLDVDWTHEITAHATQRASLAPQPGIKNVIGVGSGKGGVGKSTVACALACGLRDQGAQVGLLDADIQGPSVAHMSHTEHHQRHRVEDDALEPMNVNGVRVLSFAHLLEHRDTPVIWRGPMLGAGLQKLFFSARWGTLDYLIVDLPPGTGDVLLTCCQKIPMTGVVLVSTPQELALLDVTKAYRMFEKLNVHILGCVENMSGYRCSQCGHEAPLFGKHGMRRLAASWSCPWLGAVPLLPRIVQSADWGQSLGAGPLIDVFVDLARDVALQVAMRPRVSRRMPRVEVQS